MSLCANSGHWARFIRSARRRLIGHNWRRRIGADHHPVGSRRLWFNSFPTFSTALPITLGLVTSSNLDNGRISRFAGLLLLGIQQAWMGRAAPTREQDGHVHCILVTRWSSYPARERRVAAYWYCVAGSQRQTRVRRGSLRIPGDALAARFQDLLPETPVKP